MSTSNQQSLTDIYTDPSVDGPNLPMNTQQVVNGRIIYNDELSDLDGENSPDWAIIQWNAASAFDPAAGDDSQVWDNNFGYSVGHWTRAHPRRLLARRPITSSAILIMAIMFISSPRREESCWTFSFLLRKRWMDSIHSIIRSRRLSSRVSATIPGLPEPIRPVSISRSIFIVPR